MLLEREAALGSLAEHLHEARAGHGRLVLIAGEAGIGKTALVEQLCRNTPDVSWTWSVCDGLFTPRPLGPLADLAAQLQGDLLQLYRAGSTRDALFDALLRAVDQPGHVRVVVVEDIHWADEATLDLLRFLGRRIGSTSVVLIVTYRDDQIRPGGILRVALGELAVQRPTRRIELGPLSADAVGVLAGGSAIAPDELYKLTGGNPFYVTEVLQAGGSTMPPSARDAVLARVARLGDQARAVLDVAVLLGRYVEPQLLQAATACEPSVIDELLASGLLIGGAGHLRFRHEIARRAVEQTIGAHRRSSIHTRILDALRDTGCTDTARMAFHAEGAGSARAAFDYALAAAQQASELASHREAAAQYERALRFAGSADPALRARLYAQLAAELSLVDRWPDVAEATAQELELWRRVGDRRREGDAMRRLSRALWRLCRGKDSIAAAEQAIEVLEPHGPGPELARALAQLAGTYMANSENEQAIGLARRAQELAVRLNMPDVLSDALNTEGCAAYDFGRPWEPQLRRSLAVAQQNALEDQAGRAHANLASVLGSARRVKEAEQCYTEGIAYCDEHDITTYGSCLRGGRAGMWLQIGRWEEAAAESARLLARTVTSTINRLSPLLVLGTVRARRGEPGVWECLDEAAEGADGCAEPSRIVAVRSARAEARWLQDADDVARHEAELAGAAAVAIGDEWARGDVELWLRRTGSDQELSAAVPAPYRLQLEGDWLAAAKLWTELDCQYNAALALLDSGDVQALRRALAIFDSLGAAPAVRLTRRRMRERGMRSIPTGARATTRSNPRGLTARERDVVECICRGMTNAEIATHLVISARTVDHHVAAVLAKLGASTRSIAAAEATRLGLVRNAGWRG